MGKRCFPNPVISNDEGTERTPFVPTGREIVGKCIDENGKKVDGLTYEGELNKVTKVGDVSSAHGVYQNSLIFLSNDVQGEEGPC